MRVGVVNYHAGNLTSVKSALSYLRAEFLVSEYPEDLKNCTSLIFPGVGEAGSAMKVIRQAGWDLFFKEWIGEGKPMLGICLGHQILFDKSEEGNSECLGLIPGEVRRFDRTVNRMKIPQIGWNTVERENSSPLFDGIPEDAGFYFVHSYYTVPSDSQDIIGTTEYIGRFVSAVNHGSLFSVQFHPEKSGRFGLKLIENFLKI